MKTIEHSGHKFSINKTTRLNGNFTHDLPLGDKIDIFSVDQFEEPLKHWITGPGNYVVPVESNCGFCFDFTENDSLNTAILLSIKGMNAITGRKTTGFSLERYENKCPEHGIDFKDGLFCEKCNFKWPTQNYLSYPNMLRCDGFRTSEGKVRQFFFTEDLSKSIPELVIGKEDTVPAFGFAFFKAKKQRIREVNDNVYYPYYIYNNNVYYPYYIYNNSFYYNNKFLGHGIQCLVGESGIEDVACTQNNNVYFNTQYSSESSSSKNSINHVNAQFNTQNYSLSSNANCSNIQHNFQNKEVGVGAGAEIYQDIKADMLNLSDWEEKPSSVVRLYFVFTEQFNYLKSKGLRDLVGQREGFLAGLPVG
jgi:hypothetical protein